MESHLSYPVLCYYRSQHSNQSWLAALTTILDTCAAADRLCGKFVRWQARLTFAIARHAVVDLAQVLHTPPVMERFRTRLGPGGSGISPGIAFGGGGSDQGSRPCTRSLRDLRRMYDPPLRALSERLLMPPCPVDTAVESPGQLANERLGTTRPGLPYFRRALTSRRSPLPPGDGCTRPCATRPTRNDLSEELRDGPEWHTINDNPLSLPRTRSVLLTGNWSSPCLADGSLRRHPFRLFRAVFHSSLNACPLPRSPPAFAASSTSRMA